MGAAKTDDLFPEVRNPEGTHIINERCMIRTQDGHRVVMVSGIVLASYAVTDRMAEATRWSAWSNRGGPVSTKWQAHWAVQHGRSGEISAGLKTAGWQRWDTVAAIPKDSGAFRENAAGGFIA